MNVTQFEQLFGSFLYFIFDSFTILFFLFVLGKTFRTIFLFNKSPFK